MKVVTNVNHKNKNPPSGRWSTIDTKYQKHKGKKKKTEAKYTIIKRLQTNDKENS